MGGLQVETEVAKGNSMFKAMLATCGPTGPGCQLSHPLNALLPFIVLARVAASKCPGAFALQVPLLWWRPTLYPCDQQYPLGANFWAALDVVGRVGRRTVAGAGVACLMLLARSA